MPRPRAILVSAFVSLALAVGPNAAAASPEPEPPIEGPKPKPAAEPEPPAEPPAQAPPPHLAPELIPDDAKPTSPSLRFAVPPPGDEAAPLAAEPELSDPFPDPGIAPNDGMNLLVLGGTTLALTAMGTTTALVVGLQRNIELEWLLPSTIVPAVGLLAFAGGGLYLGIKRARAHRRWEIGYRVIGLPQGGGLIIGGSLGLLAALGFIPSGAYLVRSQPETGAALIAVGTASAIATPIMFVVGARNKRRYERTGGWKRRPIPPLPPGAVTSRLELRPVFMPLLGGASAGAAGRF